MGLKIGIVGLPNVGKSTLFNALTKTSSAEAQNYPFCTIDPNIGVVEVPDHRLYKLAEISKSEKIIPAITEFVDIAGLVKGASKGEGLGNQFLSHIRECNAIGHIVRIFEDPNVIHVHGKPDPIFDKEIIESELLLSDIQTVEKRLDKAKTEAKSNDKEKVKYAQLLEKLLLHLQSEKLACDFDISKEEKENLKDLHLLTLKPYLYIINIPEEEISKIAELGLETVQKQYAEKLGIKNTNKIIPVCAKFEQELGALNEEEADEYLESVGIKESGLNLLVKTAYEILNLITFLTTGPKETRAWTIKKNTSAPKAAGVIHTDFEKSFVKAEVINWEEFVLSGGDAKAKEKGLVRVEGKEYIVQDGDTIYFKCAS